jgi:hypothetical protein
MAVGSKSCSRRSTNAGTGTGDDDGAHQRLETASTMRSVLAWPS